MRLPQKLAIGVWLSIIPFSVAGSGFALWNAHQMELREWEGQALKEVKVIDGFVKSWDVAILKFLRLKSEDIGQINLDPVKTSKELYEIKRITPRFDFTVLAPTGTLIASTSPQKIEGLSTSSRTLRNENWFRNVMAGKSLSFLAPSKNMGASYYVSALPILSTQNNRDRKVIAVLTSQIKLSSYDNFTGLDLLFPKKTNLLDSFDALSNLDGDESRQVAAMVILKPGIIHFVGNKIISERYRNNMLDASKTKNSRWRQVIDESFKIVNGEEIKYLAIDGTKFLLAIKKSSSTMSTVVMTDHGTVFKNVNTLFVWVWLVNIISLILSSLAIYRICSALSKPVDQASEALAAISKGNFDAKLPIYSSDLGRLFNSINQTSGQLRAYFASSIKQAVVDAQLKEARLMQDSFLIKDLPSLPQIGLMASSSPAYEIGADWYDAIAIGDVVYIVVADVCDKGIPSSLFMSVFRSLLRNNIILESKSNFDPSKVILKALSTLNEYMATNHGDTAMFATIFIGAYAVAEKTLSYIVAGHEAPLLFCDQQLEPLKVGGPAVGLFRDANYVTFCCEMSTGSLLLAYSDGLPDSRNADGIPFGVNRIKTILEERRSFEWKVNELMERLHQAEADHRGEAESFDDLTLLVLKVEQIDDAVAIV